MSEHSAIEWTEATWNPWMGCTKVSPGCAHCYMFREQRQYGQDPEIVRRSKTRFLDPLRWREPRTIFTCSWSDWFHEGADQWRGDAWQVIKETPHHTYQILTKRPERILGQLPADWGEGYPNVWLGVSIESQRYDYRAALLCQFPAAVRFVSAEPLLGALNFTRVNPYSIEPKRGEVARHARFIGLNVLERPKRPPLTFRPGRRIGRIAWVIAGGESGRGYRPMDVAWLRSLRRQCAEAEVPFFAKQDRGLRPGKQGRIPDELWVQEFPNGL